MTREELRAAAHILYERGVTEGPGPITALRNRLGVPESTFAKWLHGQNKTPNIAVRYVNDLLRWSDDLELHAPGTRTWVMQRLHWAEWGGE